MSGAEKKNETKSRVTPLCAPHSEGWREGKVATMGVAVTMVVAQSGIKSTSQHNKTVRVIRLFSLGTNRQTSASALSGQWRWSGVRLVNHAMFAWI